MIRFAAVVSVFVVLFSSSVVWSADVSADSVNKLMLLSGINKQVENLPAVIFEGFKQGYSQSAGRPATDTAAYAAAIEDAFKSSKILEVVRQGLTDGMTEKDAEYLLAWYESGLGKKITKAEEFASSAQALPQMFAEARTLFSDQQRVSLANTLDEAVQATEFSLQLQNYTAIGVYATIAQVLQPENPVDLEAFKAQMSAAEPQMRANVKQLIILSYLFSYKGLTIDEIAAYVAFNKQPNTQKFNQTATHWMAQALQKSLDNLSASMALIMQRKMKDQ